MAQARLSDFLPAVARAVGYPLAESPALLLPEAGAYVVALIDGMGATLLDEHADLVPFLGSLKGQPALSEVPSTTATSLTSLGTGLPPAAHGVVGYTSRVPGTDKLLNALEWDKDVDADLWQPLPTVFEQLVESGVQCAAVGRHAFAGSGLTTSSQRGADYRSADHFGERLAEAVRAAAQAPSLTYVYDGDLDGVGHRHGVDSPQWRAQLRLIDASLEQLRDALPDEVRLLITADHGMVDVPDDRKFDLDTVPALREGVRLIGGEGRFRHLYCEPGQADDVATRWREQIGSADAMILTFDEAVEQGWFEQPSERVRPRIGDVLVASLRDFAVMSRNDHPQEFRLRGMHGSITHRERSIPLLVT